VTRDRVELAVLVLAYAALLTTHVALTIGLARRPPRWRALVAFFAFPLAPWWGWQAKMRVRAAVWVAGAVLYGVMLAVASGT
jgi:hypothetical protein